LEQFEKEPEPYWRVFDNGVAGVFRTTYSGRGEVLMCSERMASLLGFRDRKIMFVEHKPADNYVHPSTREILIDHLMEQGQVNKFEVCLRKRDGSVLWGNLSAKIFPRQGYLEGMLTDITDLKRAEEENRFLAQRLIRAQEDERRRIAHGLHDELGQALTTLQFGMNALERSLPHEFLHQKKQCERMIRKIAGIGDLVRNISHELRPGMLDQLGLVPALEGYIEDFTKDNERLKVHFEHIGFDKRLAPEIEITLYRVTQEALTNIKKHSKAGQVSVVLMLNSQEVVLIISDDGVGLNSTRTFVASKKSGRGIGILGMRERMDSIGGSLDIHSTEGEGTVIRARVPIRDNHEVC
jgi:PAS domain S-box-containing protein